jgi:hypothetical protein
MVHGAFGIEKGEAGDMIPTDQSSDTLLGDSDSYGYSDSYSDDTDYNY